MNEAEMLHLFMLLFTSLGGACVGSFLNVVICRLPKGESIVRPGSRCPSCKTSIRAWENIPVLSYLMLRGRCSNCGIRISPRYPAVEAVTGLLMLAVYLRFGLTPTALAYAYLAAVLVAITFIDLDHQIIPDRFTLPGILIGLAFAVVAQLFGPLESFPVGLWHWFLGVIVGGGTLLLVAEAFQLATGKDGMGGGDIKFLAMLGAFLGPWGALLTLFLASFYGTLISVPIALLKGQQRDTPIPFGPFIALAALTSMFFQREIIEFYHRLGDPSYYVR